MIIICPLCVYDLYRLPHNFNWRYAWEEYSIYGLAPSISSSIQDYSDEVLLLRTKQPHIMPSFHWSTQFVWFIMAGFPFISSYPLLTLLKPERLLLNNSHWMLCEVRRSVDNGLSAFELHPFTTPWSSEHRDALWGRDRTNLEAVIERVWRYTWRLWSSEFVDALRGLNWASLEMHLEAMIKRDWRSTWRRSIRREARRDLRLYSLVDS